MTLESTEPHKMNRQVEVTWITLRTISHSSMVHARVLEAYINFALIYTTDHIFLVLPIKYLINKDGEPTTPRHVRNLHYHIYACYFFICCMESYYTQRQKALSMHYEAQNGFCGIFVGISQHQKGCILYVKMTRNIIYSYGIVFD